MIKEIAGFINHLPPEFKNMGMKPKEGLHILLRIQQENGRYFMDEESVVKICSSKKPKPEDEDFLQQCASLTRVAWSVNTNKCFDLPAKGIHSCSPYSVAFKKESLEGGGKFDKDKIKIYDRISNYFKNALELVEAPEEKEKLKVFLNFINSKEKVHNILSSCEEEFANLKDAEYVIFYLDEPIESYQKTNAKYLVDKLFNTNDYNSTINEEVFGTSDFFNGFNSKKPYLTHQSATFDIPGRISAKEARALYEFGDIISRGILPRPLPIFLYKDELKQESIALFKKEAQAGSKISYQKIIETLYEKFKDDFGNYYLLYYQGGEIKDFDFVSKFEFELKDEDDNYWQIKDLFEINYSRTLKNVFDLQFAVLLPIFNNALIVKTKSGEFQNRYFDEIDGSYCKSDNTYLLVTTYRKAFYDFIYKSKRQAVTKGIFDTILRTGILDDIRLDEYKKGQHSQNINIRQKLNIWFSLSDKFDTNKTTKENMASKLQTHREAIKTLVKGETSIESDDQYAFTVGQVIYYLLTKSRTGDRSYKRLEPFMQQVHAKELNKAIARLFDTYKHETFSTNFRNPFAEVMAYQTAANMRDLMPTMLAGIFSKNELFSEREQKEVLTQPSEESEETN